MDALQLNSCSIASNVVSSRSRDVLEGDSEVRCPESEAVHSALTLSALLGVEKINDSASNIVHLHVTMDCIKFSRQKNNYQKPWAPTKNDQIP